MMAKLSIALLLILIAPLGGSAQPDGLQSSAVFRPVQANFKASLGRVLFTPGGDLFVAYRDRGDDGAHALTSTFYIAVVEPANGKTMRSANFPAPKLRLPRVIDNFAASNDGAMLAYAELVEPIIIATIEAPTLKLISRTTSSPFGKEDINPALVGLAPNGRSVFLGAGQIKGSASPGGTHFVALKATDLSRKTFDRFVPFAEPFNLDPMSASVWAADPPKNGIAEVDLATGQRLRYIQARPENGFVFLQDAVLGGERDLERLNKRGEKTAELRCPEHEWLTGGCVVTPDGSYGAAECGRLGVGESDFGRTLAREIVVFDTKSLHALARIPVSRKTIVVDRSPLRWSTAKPSPAVWHGGGRVLVAIPDFSGEVRIYSFAADQDEDPSRGHGKHR